VDFVFKYMLAPLENFSDPAFRTLCYNHGADLTFTEMIKMNALFEKNESAIKKTLLLNTTPTQIQILPAREDRLNKYLRTFKPTPGFMGFNLNLGCPDPKIQNFNRGSGMIKEVPKTKKLIKIIRSHNHPVSIKMRLGANEEEKNKKVYLNLLKETDPDFFIIHARVGNQTYSDSPDHSIFPECVNTGKTIIANGNIETKETIWSLKKIGVKGVLIGRGAVKNPAIFDQLKGKQIPIFEELKREYYSLAEQYHSSPRHKKNVLMRLGTEFVPTQKEK
jgi:tRNA-dihydrouridine synthase B